MTQTIGVGPFLDGFAGLRERLASSGPAWMQQRRREAFDRFAARGIPDRRDEAWRTTNLSPILAGGFRPVGDPPAIAAPGLPSGALTGLGGPTLVFVDGLLALGLSSPADTPDGVWVEGLARALTAHPDRIQGVLPDRDDSGSFFRDLTVALGEDGAVVVVPDGVDAGAPVELVFMATGQSSGKPLASFPRVLISAGRGSRVAVITTHLGLGPAPYFTSALQETRIGDGASVSTYRVQLEGPGAFHVSNDLSWQGQDSDFFSLGIDLGGRLIRHDVVGVLGGRGAHCQLNGLYLTDASQHVDNHTVLDHALPHGGSRELYKGILAGKSRATFNGRIIVRQDAQKTDAKQSNPNLLLSDTALAQTRPQLEIYADDVKCTHGATLGRLSEDAIFYLRSRGIAREEARNLLVRAFAGEVLDTIRIDPLRESLRRAVAERLDRAG